MQVFVDKTLYPEFMDGKKSIRDISLLDNVILEDESKMSEALTMEVFGTTDIWVCMEEATRNGDPQYSVQDRREMTEKKRKQIVEYIVKTYIDGKTRLPHPATRVENGMNTIKGLKIDLNASVSKQGDEIVKSLKGSMSFVKNETHGILYIGLEYGLSLINHNIELLEELRRSYVSGATFVVKNTWQLAIRQK